MSVPLLSYFSEQGFMPHGHCYLWKPSLIWTHLTTDLLIGLAYISISLTLYGLIRKIQIPFSAVVLSFGIFIGACGATHFMEVWNLWYAQYWLAGFVKVLTAIASVSTALWLIKLRPQIIAVADSAKLSESRRKQLEVTNQELENKTKELILSNQTLEERQKMLAHSAKMSALGEMAGGIAHEINSPLGIITIHANQLERFSKRSALTPEMIEREAQLIASTAKRIGEIIKGLRAFAREGDTDPLEPAYLNNIVQDALVLCQTKFKNHDIDLRIGSIPEDIQIYCRPVQIGQVILNLLNNAFDAVQNLPEKWVTLSVKELGDSLEISIIDSGKGLSREVQAKMMEPFFTTKEVGKGTGLGLSISKGIIENHLGTLQFDKNSMNTRFVVWLPKKHSQP